MRRQGPRGVGTITSTPTEEAERPRPQAVARARRPSSRGRCRAVKPPMLAGGGRLLPRVRCSTSVARRKDQRPPRRCSRCGLFAMFWVIVDVRLPVDRYLYNSRSKPRARRRCGSPAVPLGSYRTNCYLAALEGSPEAVVVDPGEAPDRGWRRSWSDRGWRAEAILITHTHLDHIGAVHDVAVATGAEVWMPRAEADVLRALRGGGHEPDHLVDGGDTWVGRHRFRTFAVPGHSPARSPTTPMASCSPATCSSRTARRAPIWTGGSHGHGCWRASRPCTGRPARRRVVASGHGPIDHARRRLATNPFLGTCGHEQGRPGAARHARLVPGRRGSAPLGWWTPRGPGVRGAPATARSSRRPSRTPGCSSARAGEGVRRRHEGDVHLHRPRRPSLTLRPEGTAGVVRAYIQHGMSGAAAAGQALVRRRRCSATTAMQRGRFREFQQFGVEALGSADPAVDAEMIGARSALVPAASASTAAASCS